MDKVAVIAAAGWKGIDGPLVECPIPFLSLDDGTTTLGRVSKQLRHLGFYTYVAVGPLGYPYHAYQPRGGYFTNEQVKNLLQVLKGRGVDPVASPWTEERHAYAAEYGELLIMPDPGWGNQHNTFCEAIDNIKKSWDRLLLVHGDTLFSSQLLREVLELSAPFQFDMCPNHAIFLLDEAGAQIYRTYAEDYRKRATRPEDWVSRTRLAPDGAVGLAELACRGISQYGWSHPKWKHVKDDNAHLWLDIDIAPNYSDANERIKKGYYN